MFYFYLSDLPESNGFIMIEMEAITRLQDYTLFLNPRFLKLNIYTIYLFNYILLCIYILIFIYILINIHKCFCEKLLILLYF